MFFCHHHGNALVQDAKDETLWRCPVERCRVKIHFDY